MIKILHVISDKNIGGAGRLLLNLLTEADRKQFEFLVVLPAKSRLVPKISALGVKVVESDLSLWSLFTIIKAHKPHVVHTHACAKARVAARMFGAKTVNTRHCASDKHIRVPIYKKAIIRLFDTLFTGATIATAHYVKSVLANEGVPPRKIRVIINGSLPLTKFPEQKRIEIRQDLGYTKEDFLVGMVARLEFGKGHETMIEAAKICERNAPQIKFIVVGDGSKETELKKMASGINNIKFLGFTDDVEKIMNLIDVNLNCSFISETSSLSLSEGMSVGAIPIVSDCGGNRFMAENCGFVFPKNNSEALARLLISISKDTSLQETLKKSATKRYYTLFTAKRMARENEEIYLNTLDYANKNLSK